MRLLLDDIRLDGGTQTRDSINFAAVQDYADLIQAGAKFPAIIVFYDGKEYWLADGFHRHHAHKAAALEDIEADVRQGTKADAVWFSCGANGAHGLPRTNADKRRAVTTALASPRSKGLSAVQIAEHCMVSDSFVGKIKVESGFHGGNPSVKGKDGKTQATGSKAKSAAAKARTRKLEPVPEPEEDDEAQEAPVRAAPASFSAPRYVTSAPTVALSYDEVCAYALRLPEPQQRSLIKVLLSNLDKRAA